ncbi:M48 family metalloprotease [Mesorhizobium sp. ORM8.1]
MAKERPSRVVISIPTGRVAEIQTALQDENSDAGRSMRFILAHELGHVLYHDQRRLVVLFASLLGILCSALAFVTTKQSGLESKLDPSLITISFAGFVIAASSTLFQLRYGEYYADEFAANIVGIDIAASELCKYTRREKYIKREIWSALTHPKFEQRMNVIAARHSNIIGISVAALVTLTEISLVGVVASGYLLVIPLVGFMLGAFLGLWVLILAIIFVSFFWIWLALQMVAPAAFILLEIAGKGKVLPILLPAACLGVIAVTAAALFGDDVGRALADPSVLLGAIGDSAIDLMSMPVPSQRLWGLAMLFIVGVAVGLGLMAGVAEAMTGRSIRLRRDIVLFGVCGITSVAVGWLLWIIGTPILGIALCVAVFGYLFRTWRARTFDGDYARTGTLALLDELESESLIFGIDISPIRAIERVALASLFSIPISGLYVIAVPSVGGLGSIAVYCFFVWNIYRSVRDTQDELLGRQFLIAKLGR